MKIRSAKEIAREHAEADAHMGRMGADACGCGACRQVERVTCPACFGTEDDCDSCGGRGYFLRKAA